MNEQLTSIKAQLNSAAENKDNDAIDKIWNELSDDEKKLLSGACAGNYGACFCAGYERNSPPNGTCGSCSHYAYDHSY